MQSLDQHPRRCREHREQPAHDQADRCRRYQEAAIGDQLDIVAGDRGGIERYPRRTVGFAEHPFVSDSACGGERADKGEFGAPAEIMVERTAEQRREAGRCRHRDHDQRHGARERRAGEEIAGDGARQHRGRASARGLDHAAGQ